jgi:hypothetical protein
MFRTESTLESVHPFITSVQRIYLKIWALILSNAMSDSTKYGPWHRVAAFYIFYIRYIYYIKYIKSSHPKYTKVRIWWKRTLRSTIYITYLYFYILHLDEEGSFFLAAIAFAAAQRRIDDDVRRLLRHHVRPDSTNHFLQV